MVAEQAAPLPPGCYLGSFPTPTTASQRKWCAAPQSAPIALISFNYSIAMITWSSKRKVITMHCARVQRAWGQVSPKTAVGASLFPPFAAAQSKNTVERILLKLGTLTYYVFHYNFFAQCAFLKSPGKASTQHGLGGPLLPFLFSQCCRSLMRDCCYRAAPDCLGLSAIRTQ
jgi:hypothetical protein